jgi:hypothetical protein
MACLRPLSRARSKIGTISLDGLRRAYHAPVRDMRFQLYAVHNFEQHYKQLASEVECDRDTVDMVIDESAKLCENELAPLNMGADREGELLRRYSA